MTEFLDGAMRRARTDSLKLEREHGLPSSWTRNLKSGRIKNDPDPERVKTLATALGINEKDIWTRLGRFDRVADLADPDPEAVLSAEVRAAIRLAVQEAVAATLAEFRAAGWQPPAPE